MAILKKIGTGLAAIVFAVTLAVIPGTAQGRNHWAGDGCRSHSTVRSSGYYDRYDDRYHDRYYDNRGSRTVVYRSYPTYTSNYYDRSSSRYYLYRNNPRYYTSYYPTDGNYYRAHPGYRRYPRSGLSISFGLGW